MKNVYVVLFLLFSLFGVVQESYGQLKLSGEVRPRPESQNGYRSLRSDGDKANTFISQRTRINFDYQMESLKFGVKFQDIRVWGTTPQLNASDSYLALHEAWGEIMFKPEFSLKLGRQELVYDDHRIFGSVGWAQQARSHDLGLFKYEKDFKLHVGIAYNQDKAPGFTDYKKYYKTMQFAWFHKDYSNVNMSVLFLNNGLQSFDTTTSLLTDEIRYSQTVGTFLKSNISGVNVDGSFYYQMGKDRLDKTISAYDIALNASFNLNEAFTLKAGVEILSGTDYNADADKNNSFSPFYGTNHKFNGFMDYFYVGNHANSVGLNDFNVGAAWKSGKWKAGATAHYFMSNADLYDTANAEVASAGLGTELDLSVGYKFNDWINFSGGYSQMFATSSMEILKGSGDKDVTNNWAYVMITLKPSFLDTSK